MPPDAARLATVSDAVRAKYTQSVPSNWEPPKTAHLLRGPSALLDDVIKQLSDDGTAGDPLPWEKAAHLFRLRPHEMTIWPGSNGSAKSTVLSEIMLSLVHAGRRVVVISLEMPAYKVAAKMAIQAFCDRHPARGRVEAWAEQLGDALCFLDLTGDLPASEVIKLARYCAYELGTHHLLIDNLTKVVSADNDHADEQRRFVAQLHRTAIDTGMHVHLVCHTRKPNGEEDRPPSRYEAAGSRTLVDQPDNVVTVWRDRAKERKQASGDMDLAKNADIVLNVDKQRHGDFTGYLNLWMDRSCYRFVGGWGDSSAPYASN
jgi:twinkle protein